MVRYHRITGYLLLMVNRETPRLITWLHCQIDADTTKTMSEVTTYRRSATPGVPPSGAARRRLEELRCCPLGRLVAQLQELDDEIARIRDTPKPSNIAIAALMNIKFNVLKTLLPYAWSELPKEVPGESTESRVPLAIYLDAEEILSEEAELVENINEALNEARVKFPDYVPKDRITDRSTRLV